MERGLRVAKPLVTMKDQTPLEACPKCSSSQTKIIGQSQKPMLKYAQCEACGHVFVPEEKR